MLILTIVSWPLFAVCTAGLVLWSVVLWRVRRVTSDRPTVRRGLDLAPDEEPDALPLVSIVVPAHNEERVIADCIASLRGQSHARLEIIFVLDRCTDGTAAIAQRHAAEDDRVRVIENDACPDDWAGKCHAAHLGAAVASGAWLLFTDADTAFDRDLVMASVALAAERDLALLSLLSDLTTSRRFERIVQPVASMNLIRMYPIDRVNRADGGRPFANGQFLLFRKADYDRAGGHAAVKDDLLEDIAFARLLYENGQSVGVALADGMLSCSMYDSLEAFRLGWKRIFIEACKRKPKRLRKNAARVIAIGVALPALQVVTVGLACAMAIVGDLTGTALLAGVVAGGWLAQLLTLRAVYALCGAPRGAAIFFPIGAWVVARIMLEGARDLEQRRPIPWAGRTYVLEPRS